LNPEFTPSTFNTRVPRSFFVVHDLLSLCADVIGLGEENPLGFATRLTQDLLEGDLLKGALLIQMAAVVLSGRVDTHGYGLPFGWHSGNVWHTSTEECARIPNVGAE
jgi:hypothetical protein